MPVVMANVACECGHSQVAHLMSADECFIRLVSYEENAQGDIDWATATATMCPCEKYVPAR